LTVSVGYVTESLDPDLLNLAGNDQEKVDRAILSAAFRIDSSFQRAGYAIPLDTSTITSAELRKRFDAHLDDLNRSLAAGFLTRGTAGRKGTPENIRLNLERAEDYLEQIRDGHIVVKELTVSSTQAVRRVGDVDWPDTDTLYDIEQVMIF
jgi:hypothetical protein